MQRTGEYCMHKVHKRHIYTRQRRDGVVVSTRVAMDVVVEGDSCVKKEKSAVAEYNRRRTVQ
jgi:hypothetical protein